MGAWTGSVCLRTGQVAGCCECGNEPFFTCHQWNSNDLSVARVLQKTPLLSLLLLLILCLSLKVTPVNDILILKYGHLLQEAQTSISYEITTRNVIQCCPQRQDFDHKCKNVNANNIGSNKITTLPYSALVLSCVVRFKVFCARNPLYEARNVQNRNLVSVHCCLSTVCSTRTLGMWHCAVCQLGPTVHTRLLLRLPSSTRPLRSPRSSPQRLNPNNLYFPMPCRPSASCCVS